MILWNSLPAEIRAKAEKVLANRNSDGAEVLQYLLDHAALPADSNNQHDSRTQPGSSHKQQHEEGWNLTKSAARSSSSFAHKWLLSQLMPARKSVFLCADKKQLATFNQKDDEMSIEGDWSIFNVFLLLPLPKRPRPQYNLVLTKLGGLGPFLVLSTADPAKEMLDLLETQCKYADTGVKVDQAVPAYVGAQEGLLYLLDDFLFFGFKKPLRLILVAEIDSISFTVVTSRTFNVVVKLLDDNVHEFEKIPHEYHERILAYTEEHNVNDESLAEERKAKRPKTEPSALEEALGSEIARKSGDNDISSEEDALEEDEDEDFDSDTE